jgi:threonine synthase
VTDDEIVDAIGLLARTEGIFAETAGGVTIATLAKLAASGPSAPTSAWWPWSPGTG